MEHKQGYPERQYGLGAVERNNLEGPPKIIGNGPDGVPCPNCGCERTFFIQVKVKVMPICGGSGMLSYVGCACCPWSSRALIVGVRGQ